MKIDRKIDTELFEGKVTYSIPEYQERIVLLKEMYLKNDGETVEKAEEGKTGETVYDYSLKLVEVAKKYVLDVDLKCKIEDAEIKSIEHLLCYEEGAALVGDFARTVLNGIKLGNDSNKI